MPYQNALNKRHRNCCGTKCLCKFRLMPIFALFNSLLVLLCVFSPFAHWHTPHLILFCVCVCTWTISLTMHEYKNSWKTFLIVCICQNTKLKPQKTIFHWNTKCATQFTNASETDLIFHLKNDAHMPMWPVLPPK